MHERAKPHLFDAASDDTIAHPAVVAVFDSLAVGVVVADLAGRARHVNGAWRLMSGQQDSDAAGLGWLDVVAPAHRDAVRRRMTTTVRDQRTYEDTWRVNGTHSPSRWLHVRAQPQRNGLRPAGLVVTVVDVTDDRTRTSQLIHAATHDPLTGVLNRTHFMAFIRQALDRRPGAPPRLAAVLFIDVDRLKRINDEAGHAAGDRVLVAAGRCIQRNLRPADVVARFGGDEFVVLCDDLHDHDEAVSIADRIIAAALSAGDEPVGLSIGIAFADGPDDRPETLIQRADQAMYRAKRGGRGRRELATLRDGSAPPARRRITPGMAQFVAVAVHELRTPLTLVMGYAETLSSRRNQLDDAEI